MPVEICRLAGDSVLRSKTVEELNPSPPKGLEPALPTSEAPADQTVNSKIVKFFIPAIDIHEHNNTRYCYSNLSSGLLVGGGGTGLVTHDHKRARVFRPSPRSKPTGLRVSAW
jgi:hypothetical protein